MLQIKYVNDIKSFLNLHLDYLIKAKISAGFPKGF